ncbi:MoaD/ThiS family protein [Chloroflexota bacterium]
MGKVHLEVLPSLAETLGIERTSEEIISDQENEGDRSVRELLNRLGTRYQRFSRVVFDINTQKLTGRVVIFFNGHALELVNGLETKLSDGDILTFVPFIEGG